MLRLPSRLYSLRSLAAAVACCIGLLLVAPATTASANTPSAWSRTIAGTSITYGWTNDSHGGHAWVIANYADAIARGAGFIANRLCQVVVDEEGPYLGHACEAPVVEVVSSFVRGSARLTNHGLWAAWYPFYGLRTGGTW